MEVAPSPAERARTVVRASPSLLVRTGGTAAEVFRHGTEPAGTLVLVMAPDHPVAARVRVVPGGLPVGVDATDFYPVPLPDRLRGHARLVGWVRETSLDVGPAVEEAGEDPDGDGGDCVLRVDVAEAVLADAGGEAVVVSAAEYAAARPDPLAGFEARLLGHFRAEHPAELAALAALIPPTGLDREPAAGAAPATGVDPSGRPAADHAAEPAAGGPVLPVGLDRYGLVFRMRGRDLRVPFGEPLTCAHQLPARMRDLLTRAGAAGLHVAD